MKSMERFFEKDRRAGSYLRGELKGDVLYSSYRYREVALTFGALGGGITRVEDGFTAALCRQGVITQAQKTACDQSIQSAFDSKEKIERFDTFSMEALYAHIAGIRRSVLGDAVIRRGQEEAALRAADAPWGIDQRGQKDELLARAKAAVFAISEPQWLQVMREDIAMARRLGKKICILCGDGEILMGKAQLQGWLAGEQVQYLPGEGDAALQEWIDRREAALLFYGEDGLLLCRSLTVDAFVYAQPAGFCAQALVNALDDARRCAVYVPAHWDVTRHAPLRERARLTYWQLWQLQKNHGDGVYHLSLEEMYRRYPQYFINMYQNGAQCAEAGWTLAACAQAEDPFTAVDLGREAAAAAYLNGFSNLHFSAHYFDENGCEAPLPYGQDIKEPGILVHSVRVRAARRARVISRPEDTPLRQLFAAGDAGVFSNYLFFMTPKLASLYNDLRADRPREQADVTAGHLDYMLCDENGRRVETFPLFRKMCMAMRADGAFLFCNFRLGGGSVDIAGHSFSWRAEDVDSQSAAPVKVYTPLLSCEDGDAERQTYRRLVGEGRVNIVILGDSIHCIRRGDVVLPSTGVVVSLAEQAAQALLACLPQLENGYYDAAALPLSVQLDAPEGISPEEWCTVRWAYGGGLSLMRDGRALDEAGDMAAWFAHEGWMSPLSRQTQESALHTLSRHPRTAIGCTKDGDMVIMVFSGRTKLSAGADYVQMCRLARKIEPGIWQLMNVDGGASAVLCMVRSGVMCELNCPSTSGNSCAGMARPIKTLLYIPAE